MESRLKSGVHKPYLHGSLNSARRSWIISIVQEPAGSSHGGCDKHTIDSTRDQPLQKLLTGESFVLVVAQRVRGHLIFTF